MRSALDWAPVAVFLGALASVALLIVLTIFSPHTIQHDWVWMGGDNFQQDVGECRSAARMDGSALSSGHIDTWTFEALMRGRGWTMVCRTCDVKRWER